ncbi:hypothetical protein [Streptomyces sp. NPDC051662]
MVSPLYKRGRFLGTYLCVALATLLTGIGAAADDASWMGVMSGSRR